MIDRTSLLASVPTSLCIAGQWLPAADASTFDVVDPATEQVLATVANAQPEDGRRALDAAVAVADEWAGTAPRIRAELLNAAWERVTELRDQFALLICLEMGKPLAEAYGEVDYGADFLRWFAEEAVRINGRITRSPSGNGRILVTKTPVGPVLAITPWNFPLAMGTRKIAPALAAGCPVILKPAEETPLTMLLLAKVFADVGLPAGVLSVLPTRSAAELTAPMFSDARLRKVTFTGSTAVGKRLLAQAAGSVMTSSMELGGNAPFIVFDDADIDAAVEGAMAAKMRNGGEACTAANRIYVDNRVRAEFTEKLSARMAAVTIGPGTESGVQLGPLISDKQRSTVTALVDDALSKGATATVGGKSVEGPGYFYAATVLAEVPPTAQLLKEEIFGPVAAIVGFDGEEQGIQLANDTEYGLAAYIYTEGLERAWRVSDALHAGMIGVNRGIISDVAAPFGGVKESGLGRESGSEGIEEYLEAKYVAFR
ncbi:MULTISPECIES: NAD-dependent succinate-semialdehyde dehydrogenase [Rhodococcus]|uniref:NAD-dependent succinate-semialdehyde dehydrogenase n=1 Tax=Rhodococcus TaxID=1827 RepID=UPI00058708FD|nr:MULTISPECIES: NAD-dependent succinate-semialdehyde dehydrogenase [Rhodococcus]